MKSPKNQRGHLYKSCCFGRCPSSPCPAPTVGDPNLNIACLASSEMSSSATGAETSTRPLAIAQPRIHRQFQHGGHWRSGATGHSKDSSVCGCMHACRQAGRQARSGLTHRVVNWLPVASTYCSSRSSMVPTGSKSSATEQSFATKVRSIDISTKSETTAGRPLPTSVRGEESSSCAKRRYQ